MTGGTIATTTNTLTEAIRVARRRHYRIVQTLVTRRGARLQCLTPGGRPRTIKVAGDWEGVALRHN